MDDLAGRADELSDSSFLRWRGGMAFGSLAYLLVAGLFVVYFGATQGEDGHTVRPVVVAVGWALVAAASYGYAAMFRRFRRFWGALRRWVRDQVRRDVAQADRSRLEATLTRRSTRSSPGSTSGFTVGSMVLVPFGFVLPYLALLVQLIGVVNAIGGDRAPAVDRVFMGVALLPSTLAVTVGTFVLVGITSVGTPLRTWRTEHRFGAPR